MARVRRDSGTSRWGPLMRDDRAPLLPRERSGGLFDEVVQAAKSLGVSDVEVIMGMHREALTRFANNAIHQNVSEQAQWLSVRVQVDQRTARTTTNRFDRESIQTVVKQAVGLAKSAGPGA